MIVLIVILLLFLHWDHHLYRSYERVTLETLYRNLEPEDWKEVYIRRALDRSPHVGWMSDEK